MLPDHDTVSAPQLDESVPPPGGERRMSPLRAAAEVLLCSGFPTQIAIGGLLGRIGIAPEDSPGHLSEQFVYLVSAIDTVVLLSLIAMLMRLNGDRPRDVFLQRRSWREVAIGLALVPAVFGVVLLLQLAVYLLAPFLRNVPVSPFQSMLASPQQLATFVLLVVLAGGVREELQRAFLLHRFDQALGGARLGVFVTSAAFGLGHVVQGWDAVLVTAALGAFWGLVYLWRRSVIPTVISHALFNAGEVLLAFTALSAPPG